MSRTPTQGVKLVISAAAVAATLGGWAALSAALPATSTVAAAETVAVPEWLLEPPAIPTLESVTAAQPPRVQPASVLPARPAPITITRSSR